MLEKPPNGRRLIDCVRIIVLWYSSSKVLWWSCYGTISGVPERGIQ